MSERYDPTGGEATGDEPAVEDPTRAPSDPVEERVPDEQTGGRYGGAEDFEREDPQRGQETTGGLRGG